jgi:hypothetical protein
MFGGSTFPQTVMAVAGAGASGPSAARITAPRLFGTAGSFRSLIGPTQISNNATLNRVYYRRNGTAPWFLLKDAVAAVLGSQQSVVLMDELALGVAYDFTVAALPFTSGGESALAGAALNVKIDPAVGGYTSMLHIAGNGTTFFVPLKAQASPRFTTTLDAQAVEVFGNQAPTHRYGIFDYRQIELQTFEQDTPALRQIQNLIQQALTGLSIYYRDAFGVLLLCGLAGRQMGEYKTIYRYVTLHLSEISNQFSPSTSQGSATGFRQQVNGTLVPLDISELAL